MSSGLDLEMQGAHGGGWKRYPAYKDLGVEWIGEVPEGWEITCIKRLAEPGYKTFVDGDWIETPFITDEGIRLIQTGNVGIGAYKEQGFRYIEEKTFHAFNCTEVKPRDVLICRLAEPVGRACLAPDLGVQMITSVDVCILKPNNYYDARFIVYFLSSDIYLGCINSLSRGSTRERVSRSMLGNIELVAPPLSEQHAIATFLDRETGRIDALIAKKERQIGLLQEKRAALISHAVTKGLDPDAPMKDSGVGWLGDVPEGWEVMKLRRICRVQQGLQIAQANRYAEPGPNRFEYITVKSIHADDTLVSKDYIEKPPQSVLCASDDILLARTGATGEVFSDQTGVFHNNFFKVIYDRKLVEKNYLIYYLSDIKIKKHLIMLAGTTTIPDLNHGDFLDMPFSYPTFDEQKNIVVFLDRETARIANLTNKIRESITKLREYRTALISAAVTGKIDVREELVS